METDSEVSGCSSSNATTRSHNETGVCPLPSATLRTITDVPEINETDGPDDDSPVEIPADTYDPPSLSGILGDHMVIDEPPPSPPAPKIYHGYPKRKSLFSGFAQIGLGIVSIICQAIAITYSMPEEYEYDVYNYFGVGIWCGLFVSKL